MTTIYVHTIPAALRALLTQECECEVCMPKDEAPAAPTKFDTLQAELEDTKRVAHYLREANAAKDATIASQRKIIASLESRLRGYEADMKGMEKMLASERKANAELKQMLAASQTTSREFQNKLEKIHHTIIN
jgi:chromosome segregation ATPase